MNFIRTATINHSLDLYRENYIDNAEFNYNSQLEVAAERIIQNREKKPLILLSGPSGSGKTTSALKIAEICKKRGYKLTVMSMDNYFVPKDAGELPVDENGKVDYESPDRLDIPLFTEHLRNMMECQPIDIPTFDFASQLRTKTTRFVREPNELVLLEGIHALNPNVTGDSDGFTTCLYVSVRTRISAQDTTSLHPRLIRLMRRLSRDKLFRGRSSKDIFEMFESVSRGEELYIMPYKNRSNMDIDTFMPYEASIYTHLLKNDLMKDESILCDNKNYRMIMKFMNELHPIGPELVPNDSLIREFVGGSVFEY